MMLLQSEDTKDQQRLPQHWKPGQSGNPAGRPRGARNKLSDDFLRDAYAEWQSSGPTALKAMAANDPSKFCQMVASLLPKESVLEQAGQSGISEIKLVIINSTEPRVINQVFEPEVINQSIESDADCAAAHNLDSLASSAIAPDEHNP
jgi:hypothetical protein